MSTATPAPLPGAPAAAREIRQPLLWLLGIVALGLVLRVMHFRDAPFQVDEFTALAAVAERQGVPAGMTATEDDKLVPVANLAEVSNLSRIPFGVQDPVPLYHDLLWALLHVLPAADWALRLPSLLAGVACIAGVYFLVRRPFGAEMALVAALFVALDPIQISTSWLARPYALANLFAVLSFAALWGVLHARTTATGLLLALGYAACVAVIGYLSPLLLLVVVAHVGMIVVALRRGGAARVAGFAAAGLVLGLLLLAPEFGYMSRVAAFALDHSRYLTAVHDIHLFTPFNVLFRHNLLFLGGLVLVVAAGAVVRMQLQGGGTEEKPEGEGTTPAAGETAGAPVSSTAVAVAPMATAVAPAEKVAEPVPVPAGEPLPENDEALWMGRLWVFAPQVALLLVSLLVSSVFSSRFMTYTTLGAAVLLAYYATRDNSREVRLGVSLFVALALLVFGFWPNMSTGHGLFSSPKAQIITNTLAGNGMRDVWKDGEDVILMRAGLPESDFLRTEIPEEARPQVERVLLAPLTTLYADSSRKPVILLTLSEYRNEKLKTPAGDKVKLEEFYNADLANRFKPYRRFWMTGVASDPRPNSWYYLACVVPWMATNLDRGDLVLARHREQREERYVTIKPNLGPDEPIPGLAEKEGDGWKFDGKADDYSDAVHSVKSARDVKK